MNFMSGEMSKIAAQIADQTEGVILEQLSELVKRGILVIEKGPMILTSNAREPFKIEVNQVVRLVLKDRDYIETLEKDNAEMKDLINRMNSHAR
jgi:hypothetical protein